MGWVRRAARCEVGLGRARAPAIATARPSCKPPPAPAALLLLLRPRCFRDKDAATSSALVVPWVAEGGPGSVSELASLQLLNRLPRRARAASGPAAHPGDAQELYTAVHPPCAPCSAVPRRPAIDPTWRAELSALMKPFAPQGGWCGCIGCYEGQEAAWGPRGGFEICLRCAVCGWWFSRQVSAVGARCMKAGMTQASRKQRGKGRRRAGEPERQQQARAVHTPRLDARHSRRRAS